MFTLLVNRHLLVLIFGLSFHLGIGNALAAPICIQSQNKSKLNPNILSQPLESRGLLVRDSADPSTMLSIDLTGLKVRRYGVPGPQGSLPSNGSSRFNGFQQFTAPIPLFSFHPQAGQYGRGRVVTLNSRNFSSGAQRSLEVYDVTPDDRLFPVSFGDSDTSRIGELLSGVASRILGPSAELPKFAASVLRLEKGSAGKPSLLILDLDNQVWEVDPRTMEKVSSKPLLTISRTGLKENPLIDRGLSIGTNEDEIIYHVAYGEHRLINWKTKTEIAYAVDQHSWQERLAAIRPDLRYTHVQTWGGSALFYSNVGGKSQLTWEYQSDRNMGLQVTPVKSDHSVVVIQESIGYGYETFLRQKQGLPPLEPPVNTVYDTNGKVVFRQIIKDLKSGKQITTRMAWPIGRILVYPNEIGAGGRPGRILILGQYGGEFQWVDFPEIAE